MLLENSASKNLKNLEEEKQFTTPTKNLKRILQKEIFQLEI
jgi:hypothetical protein